MSKRITILGDDGSPSIPGVQIKIENTTDKTFGLYDKGDLMRVFSADGAKVTVLRKSDGSSLITNALFSTIQNGNNGNSVFASKEELSSFVASNFFRNASMSGSIGAGANANDLGFEFLLGAGQSNMQGFTSDYDPLFDYLDPIDQFNNNPLSPNYKQFHQATIPLQSNNMFYEDNVLVNTVSPLFHFAKWYKGMIPVNRKPCLLLHAQGGTGFSTNNWNPGDDIYEGWIAAILSMLAVAPPNSRIGSVIWCQGEADGGMTKQQYSTAFDNMINDWRSRVPDAEEIPWVLIGATVPYRTTPAYDSQREVAQRNKFTTYVEGASFDGAIDTKYQPFVHYNAKGNRYNGRVSAYAVPLALANK